MKFHTDQMDEHKRKLNLRRIRQNDRDQRAAERHETLKAENAAEAEAALGAVFGKVPA